MFIDAKIENAQGEILDLMANRSRFVVEDIQGLNPPKANINMSNIYGMDGSRFDSAFLSARNLVITMMLRGDQEVSRQELYRFLNTKEWLRFYFENQNRKVYIDGYVETTEDDMFVQKQRLMASIVCPDPFFRAVDETVIDLSYSQSEFVFPFAIDMNDPIELGSYETYRRTTVFNESTNDLPFELEITTREPLPSFSWFAVSIVQTGERVGFQANTIAFNPGDVIRVNTDPSAPSMTMEAGGVVYNKIPNMTPGGTFYQIHPGANEFDFLTYPRADAEHIDVKLKFTKRYKGV